MKKISSEIKGKSIGELQKEVQKIREEITKLKLEIKVNPPKDSNLIDKKKKRLSVILTAISGRK